MTNTRRRIVFFIKVAQLVIYAWIRGIKLLPFSFHRTAAEQKKLYEEGKSKCDGYTSISKHQEWRAMDFVIVDDEDNPIWEYIESYNVLGKFWVEHLNGRWGGNFNEDSTGFSDPYHFEY